MEFTEHLTDCISLPVLLILLAVVLIYLVFLSGPRNIPPGESKWNLPASISFFMNFFKHQEATMQKMRAKYGDIFSMYMGNQLVVFVSGYDNIYQVLVKQADVFSDRPTWLPYIKQMTKIGQGPRNIPPGESKWNLPASISFFMNFFKHQEATMQKMRAKYGDIFSMYMGNQLVVFVSGYDNIYQVLVKQADVFSDRPTWLPYIKQMTKIGQGIIMNDGYSWKLLRQFTLRNLRDFGIGKTSNEDDIFIEIDALSKALMAKEEAVEIKSLMTCAVSNVIHNTVFGFRFDYEDPEFHDIIKTLDDIFRHPGILNPFDYFPLGISGLIPKARQLREHRKRVLTKLQSYVYNQIEEHEKSYDAYNIRDFVDLYLKISKEAMDEDVFTKGNIFRVICDLFVAGSETTSTSLDWAFLYMIEYPDVQKKCQEEIQEVYGNKQIRYADRGKLKYVEATLLEITRCATVVRLGVPHATKRNTTLNGYFIPENTVIIPNLESSNVDPKFWDNPKEFLPERFLDESGELVRNPALLSFSAGPRVCIGETFAKMELFLVVTNLLQRFTFYRERENIRHDLGQRHASTLQATPYKLRAVKRICEH